MNYSYKLDNDVLLVSLQGRLDTEASAKFETELAEISKENPHGSLVIDASDLEYIASGLSVKENIIVKQRKDTYSYSFMIRGGLSRLFIYRF